jgi:GNAT superfamily N-acetyltransferase
VTDGVNAVPAGPEHAAALAAFFARAGVPCYCRYWHFDGVPNAWLDRCAHHVDENRDEMLAAFDRGSDEASGIVAERDGTVVGWMKVAPAVSLPKLYSQRLYKGLSVLQGDRDGVFTVGCVLVDPSERRTRVATALLDRAIRFVGDRGGRALEAFPRRAEGIADAELWTGPFSLYTRAGFEVVHDLAPYPVMRLTLSVGWATRPSFE